MLRSLPKNKWLEKEGETGYSWFHFSPNRSWIIGFTTTALVIALSVLSAVWYINISRDVSPDSAMGYIYAFAGTAFLLLAALMYSIRRRLSKRSASQMGKLNILLCWHIFFGCMGMVLLLLHSFGNLNPRTGTYALYSMSALVISGFVGRFLDRMLPRLIASQAQHTLTKEGHDRIEHISRRLDIDAEQESQKIDGVETLFHEVPASALAPVPSAASAVEDTASVAIEEKMLDCHNMQRYSANERPGGITQTTEPLMEEEIQTLQRIQKLMKREQCYRYIIRYWRGLHISLAVLTIGLTAWHIQYALQLLLPTWLH